MAKRYSNGYLPKIEYWYSKWEAAVEAGDKIEAHKALDSVIYFAKRQKAVYGDNQNVIAGVDFSESLNLLNSL